MRDYTLTKNFCKDTFTKVYKTHNFIKDNTPYNFVEQSYPVRYVLDIAMRYAYNTFVKWVVLLFKTQCHALECYMITSVRICPTSGSAGKLLTLQYNQLWNYDIPVHNTALATQTVAVLNSLLLYHYGSSTQKIFNFKKKLNIKL